MACQTSDSKALMFVLLRMVVVIDEVARASGLSQARPLWNIPSELTSIA